MEEKLKKQLAEEEEKLRLEILKKNLRKQYSQAPFLTENQPKEPENETKLAEKQSKKERNKKGVISAEIVDFAAEEDRDLDSLNLEIVRNRAFFRHLFGKYGGFAPKKKVELLEMREKYERMSADNIWKMLKNMGLAAGCSKEQIRKVVRAIGGDEGVDFEEFGRVLAQFCVNWFMVRWGNR